MTSRPQPWAKLISWVVTVALAAQIHAGLRPATAASACSSLPCLYLPFVATPPPVRVNTVYLAPHIGGYSYAAGDIINTATYPVYHVTLAADFYTFSGYQYTVTGTTALSVTFSGQLNPYNLFWEYGGRGITRVDVRVVTWATTSTLTYQPLTVVYSTTGPFDQVFATLRNDSPYILTDVRAVAWAGSETNEAVKVASSIQPSATVTYSAVIQPMPSLNFVHIAAQGVVSP